MTLKCDKERNGLRMNIIRKFFAVILCFSMICGCAFGEVLYEDKMDSASDKWNFGALAEITSESGNKALKLDGKNNFVYVTKDSYYDLAAYAKFSSATASSASGYVGAAVRCAENSRYEARVYPESKRVTLVRVDNGEKTLGSAEFKIADKAFDLKLAVKNNTLRVFANGGLLLSVIDDNPLSDGGVAVVADNVSVTAEEVNLYTESSWLYEDFNCGKLSSFSDNSFMPEITSSAGGTFSVVKDGDNLVLSPTLNDDTARIIYPVSKISDTAATAVIANVKTNGWGLSTEEGGFSLYSRYTALNQTYKMSISNGSVLIKKIMPTETETVAKSEVLAFDEDVYHEVAFETINKADGSVLLNGYIDGSLAASAVDDYAPYSYGKFGIEKSGVMSLYINDINFKNVDADKTLSDEYAGRPKKKITMLVNGADAEFDVEPREVDGCISMSVRQMSEILNAHYSESGDSASISKDGLNVSITSGSDKIHINGTETEMSFAADKSSDKICASANFVMGLFGAITSFDAETKVFTVSYDNNVLSETNIYTKDGNIFATSRDGLKFRYAKVSGVDGFYRSSEEKESLTRPIWKAYFIDEATAAANVIPENPTKGYYGSNWVLGNCTTDSREAKLKDTVWNAETGELILYYTHERVDVAAHIKLGGNKIEMYADVTNKSDYPLQFITIPSEWSYCYSVNNDLLLPTSYAMVEYDTITWYRYTSAACVMDGYAVTGNGVASTYFVQHEQKDGDDEYIMATDTQIYGGDFARSMRVSPGTVVYREKGESVTSVPCVISSTPNLRTMADEYVKTCYPNARRVREKIQKEQDKETVPKSNVFHLSTIGNKFTDMTEFAKKAPGHSMFHMTAVLGHTNKGYSYWDAFPNYFPPYEYLGTMEDWTEFMTVANENGHSYLPRNSLFYGTEGSRLDEQIKAEQAANGEEQTGIYDLAIKHFSGPRQKAVWGVPGVLYSPASKRAMQFFEETWNTWQSMGVSNFFTNVITVMNPMKQRYDFHPDADRPDHEYDYQAKLMKWHGDRAPLYSEGLDISRLPYQAGFMTDARWDPDYDTPPFGKETFIRMRYDITAMMISEYARIFPHNVSDENQNSNRALTFSLLYNYGLKMRLDVGKQPTVDNLRWIRGQAILGELVMDRLYGQKLMKELDYSKQELVADYGGNIVTGTLENNPLVKSDRTISKEGFEFKSKDGKVTAGTYDRFNNHELEQSTLLLFENRDDGTKRIYAPVTDKEISLNVPTDGIQSPKIVAHYADGTTEEVSGTFDGKNLSFVYPVFPTSDGNDVTLSNGTVIAMSKLVPYIEITNGGSDKVSVLSNSVFIKTYVPFETYSTLKKIPDSVNALVIIENASENSVSGNVTVSGQYFGTKVDETFAVNSNEAKIVLPLKLYKDPFSTDTGANLKLTSNIDGAVIENGGALNIQKQDLSMLNSISDIESGDKYKIRLDWNAAADDDLPDMFEITENTGINKFGDAISMNKGEKLTLSSSLIGSISDATTVKHYYAEMLLKFTDLTKYVYKNAMCNQIMSANGTSKTPISLQYNAFDNCFKLVATPESGSAVTLNLADVQVHLNEMYHVVIEIDGSTAKLRVNGESMSADFTSGYAALDGTVTFGDRMGTDLSYLRIGN